MIALLWFVLAVLVSPFKSKSWLEAENAALRHQLIVLRRQVRGRVQLSNNDCWFFVQLYRWFPSILAVITVIRPETLVRCKRGRNGDEVPQGSCVTRYHRCAEQGDRLARLCLRTGAF
jgi:hypothetical protein